MRISAHEHEKRPWRVRSLAADFELLDVWEYPILADAAAGEDFAMFCRMLKNDTSSSEPPVRGFAGFLFRVRNWLGRVFKLDDTTPLTIPGSTEHSLRERLSKEERSAMSTSADAAPDALGFREVYRLDDELLMEISNTTVHALLHVGWVHKQGTQYAPQLAVYAKSRGKLGRLYMAMIAPFRHLVVYPAMMRSAKTRWTALTSELRAAG